MKKNLQRLKLKCQHWKGQSWSKGQQLKDFSKYVRSVDVKRHLLAKRGHKCERCGLSEWQGEKIPIQLQHISADRTDNRQQNLLLLCCNCHALTPTWRGRSNKQKFCPKPKIKFLCSCGKQKSRYSKNCMACSSQILSSTLTNISPNKQEIQKKLIQFKFVMNRVAQFYNVSDTTMRKRCKRLNINYHK